MKKFITAFKLALQLRKFQIFAEDEDFWTKEDSEFLGSSTVAKKLLITIDNAAMKAAMEASQPSVGGEHRRGMAYGFALAALFIRAKFPQSAGQADDIEEQELDDLIPERLVTPIRS